MEESQQQQQQQHTNHASTNHANTNHASSTNENADPLPETSEIQRLDADTVRRITAEQAISDLTSIVKELMDNALDAESTTIKIRLFGQGLDIIEVSDDGNGVPEGSLPYVATRHATSKIERLDDIYSGTGLTMGFRGEALFATACVSDSLVVASRTNEQELATKLVFGTDGRPLVSAGAGAGGAETGRDAAAGAAAAAAAGPTSELLARKVGTTVAVVGPFGRLPARRADLVRRIKDERTKIFKLVEAYGIFNVGVSFHLIDIINNNNNTKHNTKHNNTKNNNNHNHNTNHNTNQREEAVLQTSARSRSLEETASTLLGPVFVRGATRIEISLESYFRRQQQQQKATTQQRDNNNNNNNNNNKTNNDDDDDDYHWGIGGLISMEPFELARQQLQSQSRGRSTSASTKHNNNNNNNNNKHHHKTSGGANNRVRSVQYYSINGRIVLLPKVTAILKKLWTNACTQCSTAANMKPPKKPSALLAFTLPNRAFDINLSPDKKEVLFTDEDELMGILEEHVARMWSASTLASGGAGAGGGSSSSHVFVDQSNSCLSKPRSKPSRVAVARVSDAGIPNNNNTNNTTNDCASSCKSITEEEEGEDCEDEYEYDDDDDDEYDDEHHKRRFAFVHDVSKAKMQHESESRHKDGRRFGRKRRSRHHDHSDIDADSTRSSSNSSSNSNCNSNSASDPSTTDAFPDPDADADATQQQHQHQHQQQQSLNNNNNDDDDDEEEEYPRQLRQTKLTPVVVVANQKSKTTTTTTALRPAPKPVDECTDSSPIHEETEEEQPQQQQPQPPSGVVDRISDSDRLKWNEIQSRFRRRDSDEMNLKLKMDDDVDVDNDNKVADNNNNNDNDRNDEREPIHRLSRSVSVGGLRRSAANNKKAPVTPEEDHEQFAGAEPRSGGASKSGKTTTPDTDTDTGCEHEHECEPPSARRSRLANLEQFSHPGGNGNDGSGSGSTATTRDKKRQRLSKLGALQQFAAHNPSANNADFHADAAGSSKPRRRTGTADGAGAKDDSSTTTAADTSQVKVQVAWESFVSTEDVCSRARTERLNMRKRKQELHDIRRLVKSRARDEHGNESEQEQEHPDSTNEIRTRTRTEAKSDEEEEDDDDNAGGDSFIRISKSTFRSGMKVIGQFNLGFILAICPQNHLWILDQHACDEKYNFEQLCKTTVLHVQPLIRPLPLELTPSEEACVLDHRDIFATNGFKFEFDPGAPIRHRLSLTSLPHSGAREGRKAVGFGPADVSTLCAVLTEGSSYEAGSGGTGTDGTGIYGNNAVRRHAATSISVSSTSSSTTRDNANANADRLLTRLPKAVAMFASRACRTSIMIGTALSQKEMAAIVKKLSATDSPWNCPHGRPTMRHVKNVLPLLWKDERRAAEHVALRSIHP